MTKTNMVNSRLNSIEERLLEAIAKIEGLNKSATIRHAIRFTARAYNLLPAVDCPNCESRQVEQTADDLLVCEKCGQEFVYQPQAGEPCPLCGYFVPDGEK